MDLTDIFLSKLDSDVVLLHFGKCSRTTELDMTLGEAQTTNNNMDSGDCTDYSHQHGGNGVFLKCGLYIQ